MRHLSCQLHTEKKKHSFVSLSIPPNTQTPSTRFPLWYFLLPNLLSSISTVCPTPPICCEQPCYMRSQTSLQKLYQSTIVCWAMSSSWITKSALALYTQKYVISRIFSSVRLLLEYQDPCHIETFLHTVYWNTSSGSCLYWRWGLF